MTASDVRIMPVEYSDVIVRVPRTTTMSWPSRASPTMLAWVGSKPARTTAGVCAQCAAVPAQSATAQARPASTSTASVQ